MSQYLISHGTWSGLNIPIYGGPACFDLCSLSGSSAAYASDQDGIEVEAHYSPVEDPEKTAVPQCTAKLENDGVRPQLPPCLPHKQGASNEDSEGFSHGYTWVEGKWQTLLDINGMSLSGGSHINEAQARSAAIRLYNTHRAAGPEAAVRAHIASPASQPSSSPSAADSQPSPYPHHKKRSRSPSSAAQHVKQPLLRPSFQAPKDPHGTVSSPVPPPLDGSQQQRPFSSPYQLRQQHPNLSVQKGQAACPQPTPKQSGHSDGRYQLPGLLRKPGGKWFRGYYGQQSRGASTPLAWHYKVDIRIKVEGRSQRVRAPSTFSLEAEAAKGAVSEFERLKLGETRSLADAQKDSDWQQEVQAMRTAGQYQPAILAAAAAADAAASQPEPTVKVPDGDQPAPTRTDHGPSLPAPSKRRKQASRPQQPAVLPQESVALPRTSTAAPGPVPCTGGSEPSSAAANSEGAAVPAGEPSAGMSQQLAQPVLAMVPHTAAPTPASVIEALDPSIRDALNVMGKSLWDAHMDRAHRARSLLEICQIFCVGVDARLSAEELLRQQYPLAAPELLAEVAAAFAVAP